MHYIQKFFFSYLCRLKSRKKTNLLIQKSLQIDKIKVDFQVGGRQQEFDLFPHPESSIFDIVHYWTGYLVDWIVYYGIDVIVSYCHLFHVLFNLYNNYLKMSVCYLRVYFPFNCYLFAAYIVYIKIKHILLKLRFKRYKLSQSNKNIFGQ